jgi:hypothetical protein
MDSLDERRKLRQVGMRFDTWIIRRLYRAGWRMRVGEGLSECELQLECRRSDGTGVEAN